MSHTISHGSSFLVSPCGFVTVNTIIRLAPSKSHSWDKLLVTISSLVQVSRFHIHRCSQWKCLSCSIIWMELPQSQSRSLKVDGSFQLKVESGEESLLPPLMKHDSHLDTFKTNEAEKNSFRGKWTFGEKWNLRGEHWGSNEHLRNQDLGRNEHSEADLNLKFFFETKQKVDEFFHIQM